MARRKNTSPLEDFLDLVALLPWWGGVALAFASYLVLHQIAASPAGLPAPPGQMAGFVVASIFTSAAAVLQYLLPPFILLGALGSFYRRKRRQSLLADVAQSRSADALESMSWREFELLVGEAFRLQGYNVMELGGDGPDGGVDLVLRKGDEKFLVQCKQWKAFKVGVAVVRELYGVMAARGASGGFVVTSGRFTAEAFAFAEGRNIRLVDGQVLLGMIKQARRAAGRVAVAPSKPPPVKAWVEAVATTPSCPSCGVPMKTRTAKRGRNIGQTFWGCTSYPACKGTRSL